jgi:signal peptidase
MGAVADFLKSSVGFLLVVVLPMALFFLYELYNLLKIIMEQKMQKAAATASATVSAETEEEIKRRAIEEFLAQQAAANAEKPADSDEE